MNRPMPASFRAALIALGALACTAASAAPVAPTSYDIPNGSGNASGGSYNYWDLSYSGSGTTNLDGAPLSGGLGDLTDGVTTTLNWDAIEVTAGTGPYVGWRDERTPVVALTFRFGAAPVDIETVRIHADESKTGGVDLPTQVVFTWEAGGTQTRTFAIADPTPGGVAPSWLTFSGLGIQDVGSLQIGLSYGSQWIFVDEIAFDSAPVPEPAALGLMLAGLGVVGSAARRARRRAR